MAKPNTKPYNLITPLVFFTILIISFSSSSAARLLNMPLNLATNKPLLELELPKDKLVVAYYPLKKDSHHAFPCHDMEPTKPKVGFPGAPRLSRKYRPLLLSILPKGTPTAPSGPSPDINDVNN
jgi:hypothetical protein